MAGTARGEAGRKTWKASRRRSARSARSRSRAAARSSAARSSASVGSLAKRSLALAPPRCRRESSATPRHSDDSGSSSCSRAAAVRGDPARRGSCARGPWGRLFLHAAQKAQRSPTAGDSSFHSAVGAGGGYSADFAAAWVGA